MLRILGVFFSNSQKLTFNFSLKAEINAMKTGGC